MHACTIQKHIQSKSFSTIGQKYTPAIWYHTDWAGSKVLKKKHPHSKSSENGSNHVSTTARNSSKKENYRDFSIWWVHFLPVVLSKFMSWRFNSKSSELKKTLLAAFATVCAFSLAASIFLRVINAGLLAIAWPISWALFASPCNRHAEKQMF